MSSLFCPLYPLRSIMHESINIGILAEESPKKNKKTVFYPFFFSAISPPQSHATSPTHGQLDMVDIFMSPTFLMISLTRKYRF